MAKPTPVVPHNFGEKYFDSKHHSNIEVILKDGKKIKVNSMIMAVNSPYLEEIIEKKNLKTIEMDEFDAAVCKRFLKSLYTGDFGTLDKDIFRQASKLSYTFQVTWIQQKCLEYFSTLMNAAPNKVSVDDDEKFLMEEAIAAKAFDKDGKYLNALAQKKTSIMCNQEILRMAKMLGDLKTLPLDQLDFFIRLANKSIRYATNQQINCRTHSYEYIPKEYSTIIVEKVTAHLEKQEKMDAKTRYVLGNLDFSGITSKFNKNQGYQDSFKAAASKLFQSLLNLKEISNDDMKMTLKHYMSLGN